MVAIEPQQTTCTLCPRLCGADRTRAAGLCGAGGRVRVARAAPHFWEEPAISGTHGSGAVFFSGCPLRCCFCQNARLSAENIGREISVARLAEIFLELEGQRVHNLNLVSPTQYTPWILQALQIACPRLPVIWNTGGYERIETLRRLEGQVNLYLPDLKFYDAGRAARYARAGDYFTVAAPALREMYRQTGPVRYDADGLLQSGLLIRHLMLPTGLADTIQLLDWIAENLPVEGVRISLMSQYTPMGADMAHPELNRRISSYEYRKALAHAQQLGLQGYMQARDSAEAAYTPPFDFTGV